MPEGPEVYCNAEILAGKELNQTLVQLKFDDKAHCQITTDIILPDKLIYCFSYGKKLILGTIQFYLIFSLGMTGAFTYDQNKPHIRCSLIFNDHSLYFVDPRNFGKIEVVNLEQLDIKINSLGLDIIDLILTNRLTFAFWLKHWHKYCRGRSTIVDDLINQNIFAGIGNYLRSEILYIAEIHPLRLTASLTEQELYQLWLAAIKVLTSAVKQGGFTIKSFYLPNGLNGGYQPFIYGRSQDDEEQEIVKITHKTRAIYFAPHKQKLN